MPQRKRVKKNKSNENALTTRLIQISMKMDDHIYNNNPMTSAEAAAYLQEIATLKLRCLPTNTRALQVIEKLTRLMNNILTEDVRQNSSSYNETFLITSQYVRSSSPVYSLPDEDRNLNITEQNDVEDLNLTHVTDEDMHREMDTPNRQIVTINTYQVQDTTYCETARSAKTHTEVIDLTRDSDIEGIENVTVTNELNASVEHVKTGISNMTLQDQLGSDIDTCSQSILDNYNNDRKDVIVKKGGTIKMVLRNDSITSNANNVKDNFQIPLAAMTSQATIASPKLLVSQPTIEEHGIDEHIKSNSLEKTVKTKKREKIAINNKENNVKRRRTKKNKETELDNAVEICQKTSLHTPIHAEHISKCSHNKENYLKTAKKPKNRKNIKEIYNENVENDLSWVENLRFVRETSPSEYDPALTMLHDDFWNNFQLPGTWDDLDFNV